MRLWLLCIVVAVLKCALAEGACDAGEHTAACSDRLLLVSARTLCGKNATREDRLTLCVPPCTIAGSINLELVSAGACTSNPFAKCFSSMMVEVDSDCDITAIPIGAGNTVPAMWTGGSAPYAALQACPAVGDSGLSASSTSSSLLADLGSLLAGAIWDTPLATAPTITTGTGIVTIADGSCTLKYRASNYTVGNWTLDICACTMDSVVIGIAARLLTIHAVLCRAPGFLASPVWRAQQARNALQAWLDAPQQAPTQCP